MASIYDLKPAFQNLLRPLARRLVAAGVTANAVTVTAMVLSLAVGALIAWRPLEHWPLLLLPAALLVRMALNALDGMMAREHGQASPLGGMLNELGDVVSDTALYLPLALVPDLDPLLIVLVVVAAALTEVAGLAAVQIGASRRYDGPMGKSDRAFVFGLLGLVLAHVHLPGTALDAVLVVVLALSVLTVVVRTRRALAEVTDGAKAGKR